MIKNKAFIFAAVLVVSVGAVGVFAQNSEPCHADAEKFCRNAQGPARMACMKQHEAELSAECKARMAGRKEKMPENQPCMAEAAKLCPGMKPGDGKFMACLKQHETNLSAPCKAHVAERKEKAVKNHPCMGEAAKLCPGMKPGDGKFMPCLKQHAAELSPACKAKVSEKREGKRQSGEAKKPGQPTGQGTYLTN